METVNQKVKTLEDDMMDIINIIPKLDTNFSEKVDNFKSDIKNITISSNQEFQNIDKRINKLETKFTNITGPSQDNLVMPVDPRVIKDSLPEFYGRLEECPAHFLNNCESLLGRTNIPEEVYLQTVTQQLKGSAGSW